jgi:outer membrane biosynthesis protein TonB
LGGTLIKEIQDIKIKALPQSLPHSIKVSVAKLNTFEDEVLINDLEIPEGVKVMRDKKEIIAKVVPPEKVEEELEKPIEEKVEEVEKVEKERKEKEEPIESEPSAAAAKTPAEKKAPEGRSSKS